MKPKSHTSSDAGNASHEESAQRVLVVDDNEDAADSLAQYVDTLGYATRVAHDGLEALRVAREFLPNFVLLDIGLPHMDGYEVADRLRQIPGLEHTHLLAVTGYGQDTDREQSLRAGFTAHLVKPIDLKAFQRILESPPDTLARK